MADRIIEKIDVQDCGCYTRRITETWMGELVTDEHQVLCDKHW